MRTNNKVPKQKIMHRRSIRSKINNRKNTTIHQFNRPEFLSLTDLKKCLRQNKAKGDDSPFTHKQIPLDMVKTIEDYYLRVQQFADQN